MEHLSLTIGSCSLQGRIISHVQVFFSVVFVSSILFNNQLFITIRACNRTPKRKKKNWRPANHGRNQCKLLLNMYNKRACQHACTSSADYLSSSSPAPPAARARQERVQVRTATSATRSPVS